MGPPVFNSPTGKLTKRRLSKHWAPAHLFGSHDSHWQRLKLNLPAERSSFVLYNRMTDAMFGGRQSSMHLWMKKGRGQPAGREVLLLWRSTDCSALVILLNQWTSLFYKLCSYKQWGDKFCLHERARSYVSVCHPWTYTHALTELRGATELCKYMMLFAL